MKTTAAFLFFLLAGNFLFLLFTRAETHAIPAFAREHKVTCTLCHVGFPKLNQVGINFKQNGYRMPDDPGSYIWEKDAIPLGFRANFSIPSYIDRDWNFITGGDTRVPPEEADGAPGEVRTDYSETAFKINNWELLSGGTLAPRVSYFFQVVGEIEGQDVGNFKFPAPGDSGEGDENHGPNFTEIETEALVIQFDDILPDALLNFRLGKDHIDNLFFSRPRRLTLASYTTMFQPVTGGSLHANVVGIEANGVHKPTGLWYAVGYRNLHPRFNSNDVIEVRPGAFYAFVNYPFFEGQTLGLMFATDKIGNKNETGSVPEFPDTSDRTYGMGGVLDLNWGDFNLMPAFYYYEEGKNAHEGEELNIISGTIEAHYNILPELIFTARWDFLDVIDQPDGVFEDDIDQFVASLAWYLHPNVRIVAEYSYLEAQLNRMTTFPFNNDLFVSVPGSLPGPPPRANLTVNKAVLAVEVGF